jgi:hypothetical protein
MHSNIAEKYSKLFWMEDLPWKMFVFPGRIWNLMLLE